MTSDDTPPPRSIELKVEVPGTPEQVWEEIATGRGITAWMHPTEGEESKGGSFSYDMGSGMSSSGRVMGPAAPLRHGVGSDWDEEIEGVSEGMRLALENLRVYLTHFAGRRARGSGRSATAAVAAREEPAWREWMQARFPSSSPA